MSKARTELIHCDNCGEDYAATYRRCPFCSGKASRQVEDYEDYDDYGEAPRRGGKRLAGGAPGGGGDPAKIAIYVLAALVLVAVICVLLSIIIPKLVAPAPSAEPSPSDAVSAAPSAEPSIEPTQVPTENNTQDPATSFHPLPVIDGAGDDPLDLDSPDLPPVEPDPVSSAGVTTPAPSTTPKPSTPPASQAPSSGLKLSSTDFTLSPRYPTYQLETGLGRALVTYSVKNEAVATISSTGLVTAVGDGNTTITVTDQNGATATAIVRVSGISGQSAQAPASDAPTSDAPASQAPAGKARLNLTDFSINAQYPDPVRLRVRDGQAAGWKSGNTSVATVSDNGTVTAVGNGHAKITCTLDDGSTLTCDVYVSGL